MNYKPGNYSHQSTGWSNETEPVEARLKAIDRTCVGKPGKECKWHVIEIRWECLRDDVEALKTKTVDHEPLP